MATLHKFFRVTVPVAVDTLTVGEGFVDDRKANDFSALPTTLANSLNKERANMRWEEILKQLNEITCVSVTDIDKTGGDQDTAPTVIAFTVGFESDKIVFIHDLVTDPTGNTIYGPQAASLASSVTVNVATELEVIERAVATALSTSTFVDSREIIDPTETSGAIRFPNQFQDVTCTQFGTGGTQALRMASIEAIGGLTVVQLDINTL